MRVRVSTALRLPADQVYALIQRPALLAHVSAPLLKFTSREPDGFPGVWSAGAHRVAMWAFGLIPLGAQTIGIEIGPNDPAAGRYQVRDNGSGQLVRVWDHLITLQADGPDRTIYTDTVEIKAGLLTPGIWLFAQALYRWRQARWRALAARGGTL